EGDGRDVTCTPSHPVVPSGSITPHEPGGAPREARHAPGTAARLDRPHRSRLYLPAPRFPLRAAAAATTHHHHPPPPPPPPLPPPPPPLPPPSPPRPRLSARSHITSPRRRLASALEATTRGTRRGAGSHGDYSTRIRVLDVLKKPFLTRLRLAVGI
ncbi:Protein of unknown function, partial [Gryllus bimaculatus]